MYRGLRYSLNMTNELAQTREEPAFTMDQLINGKVPTMEKMPVNADIIRRCIFRVSRPIADARFHLTMWDTHRTDDMGKSVIGYKLVKSHGGSGVIFEGEDYYCSPCHAIDSDESVRSLMNFLTLRPGDTDSEYFEGYTSEQRAFCDEYAEELQMAVMDRFGEEL